MDIAERFRRAKEARETYADFLTFLDEAMEFLGFKLTWMQADIGDFMQHGPKLRAVFAQRSEAKSTVACIYGMWRIVQQPSTRVVLVSASSPKAEENGMLMHRLLMQWPVLEYLQPDTTAGDRASVKQFDVHYALKGIDKSASVFCVGITGQMTGFRADVLIADDIEVRNNSETPTQRSKLVDRSKEFTSICDGGEIIYLGTPQSKDSIYNTLPARGVEIRIWPGRFPSAEHCDAYGDRLAGSIARKMAADPTLVTGGGLDGTRGKPTDPMRMDEAKLQEKELDQGPETFELQFMLNTKLMDAARQQLKLRDLIVLETGGDMVPEVLEWAPTPQNRIELPVDFPVTGAQLHGPGFASSQFAKLENRVMTVDPAAEGGDEVAFACGGALGPYIHITDWGGLKGGLSEDNMTKLLDIAKENKCDRVIVEHNLGGGIATKLLQGHASKIGSTAAVSDSTASTGQKEKRIIDAVGPVQRRHRLVMHKRAIDRDLETLQAYSRDKRSVYSGFLQMDQLTTDRGCLTKDDRIDVLEQAVRVLSHVLVNDEDKAAEIRAATKAKDFLANPMGVPTHVLNKATRPVKGQAYLHNRFLR